MTACFNENSPSCECQSDSIIQKTSREIEEERSKIGKSKESR